MSASLQFKYFAKEFNRLYTFESEKKGADDGATVFVGGETILLQTSQRLFLKAEHPPSNVHLVCNVDHLVSNVHLVCM